MKRSTLLNSTTGVFDSLKVRNPPYSGAYVEVTALGGGGGSYDDSEIRGLIAANTTLVNATATAMSGFQASLDDKVDDGQVLTDVPSGSVFTDTIYTHPATHSVAEISGLQGLLDGKVDDSQVLTDVPVGAVFSDTIYTHPATHSVAEISGLQGLLDGKVDDLSLIHI